MAAIADPLRFGFGIFPDPRALRLLWSSFIHQRLPPRHNNPLCSLHRVLSHLSFTRYTNDISPGDSLHHAVFIIALASELLVALVHAPSLLQFSTGDVSLAPHPLFLAKNVRHRLFPEQVPGSHEGNSPHTLCSVAALRAY